MKMSATEFLVAAAQNKKDAIRTLQRLHVAKERPKGPRPCIKKKARDKRLSKHLNDAVRLLYNEAIGLKDVSPSHQP